MKPIKHLYLHFTDGQRLSLRFPRQQDDPAEVARSIRQQLDTPYLSVEVDGDLLLIPALARVEKSKRMPPQITLEENGYFMMNSHLMERGIYIPRPRSRT